MRAIDLFLFTLITAVFLSAAILTALAGFQAALMPLVEVLASR